MSQLRLTHPSQFEKFVYNTELMPFSKSKCFFQKIKDLLHKIHRGWKVALDLRQPNRNPFLKS